MSINVELVNFVKEALVNKQSRSQIQEALTQAGWSSDQIKSALASFANIQFPVPIPTPKPYLSARETFLYLVLFTTLYISAINLGTLCFQFINLNFPELITNSGFGEYSRKAIRWSVSSLLIAFPIFSYLSYLVNRWIKKDSSKRASKVRKWLTHLTLFITAVVIISDLISLVYNLLSGELTLRFSLKVLTIGIISGSIFGYYIWEMHQDEKETKS